MILTYCILKISPTPYKSNQIRALFLDKAKSKRKFTSFIMEPKKMDSSNQDHHNKTTRRSTDEKIHAEQVIVDKAEYEEEDSTYELMCNVIEGQTMKQRAMNDEMSGSRMEKFKEILHVDGEEERVAEIVRQLKDEAELQREKELEDLEKKASASWRSHLLSFHDAVDARSLWKAIKARFGGNEASKKMHLTPAYLPTIFFGVARIVDNDSGGQPGLEISPNIAFMSTEVKGSTLKQSTAEPTNIPKGYTQAAQAQGFGVESSSDMESDNSSGNTNSNESLYSNFQKEKGFHSVPPPTGTIIPPRANFIIEIWVDSDDEETVLNPSETQKKTILNLENSDTSFENKSPSSQNSVGQGSRKKDLQTKPKLINLRANTGSRTLRAVWQNLQKGLVNHSNFLRNSRYHHQRRFFYPSLKYVEMYLQREGCEKVTARPINDHKPVPSKSTANVFYQGTARSRVPQAVLSRSTGRPYYPRMDNRRPRISSYSPSSRSSTTRTPNRPHRPKKIVKSIWVKKGSTVGSQAVLPQNGNPEEDLKDYAIIDSGCSGSMTGDKDKLSDFKDYKG
ncbi:hypothetical protein Tco_1236738 [Tanacetum coccineum]